MHQKVTNTETDSRGNDQPHGAAGVWWLALAFLGPVVKFWLKFAPYSRHSAVCREYSIVRIIMREGIQYSLYLAQKLIYSQPKMMYAHTEKKNLNKYFNTTFIQTSQEQDKLLLISTSTYESNLYSSFDSYKFNLYGSFPFPEVCTHHFRLTLYLCEFIIVSHHVFFTTCQTLSPVLALTVIVAKNYCFFHLALVSTT